MKLFLSLIVLGLSACAGNGLAPGKTAAQAASINTQLAIEYLRIGKIAPARDFIERAIHQDPNDANVQSTAGMIYERMGEMTKAEHFFASAGRLGKDDPNIQNNVAGFMCRTGKASEGEKIFDAVARNPLYQQPEIALVNAGVCLRGAGNEVDAERYFRRALLIRQNYPEALLQLGNLSYDRDDNIQALELAQRYLSANSSSPDILWLALRAERKLGDATAAAGFARRLQTDFPDSEQAQMMRSGTSR